MSEDRFIRDYFNGNLTPDDQMKFEERYQEDRVFRDMANQAELEILAIRESSREQLKSRFGDWEPNEEGARVVRFSNIWKMGIAASILLMVGFAYWLMPVNRSGDELFHAYYETYENFEITVSRGETDENVSTIDMAFQAFDKQDYSMAADRFEEIGVDHQKYGAAMFFLGVSLIEEERIEEALTSFQKVVDLEDPDYSEAALWYQGLIQVKQGSRAMAKKTLTAIAEGQGEYSVEANALLQDLN